MEKIRKKDINLAIVSESVAVRMEYPAPQEEMTGLDPSRTDGIEILSEKEYIDNINNYEELEKDLRERRRDFRIGVMLTGSYIAMGSGERGLIALKDISYSGLRYELNTAREFYEQAKKLISFSLDTYPLTVIRREVIIKNVSGKLIGAEFVNQYEHDALPPYLRFKKRR